MRRLIILCTIFLSAALVRAENYEHCVEQALRANAYPAAINCLRDAELSEPKSYRIAFLFGDVFVRAKQIDSAEIHLRRAIQLRDDYTEAYDLLGSVLVEKKDFAGAVDAYQHAIATERRSPTYTSSVGLGHAYAMSDSFKLATLWLSKAIDLDHTQLGAYIELGDLYLRSKVYILAREQYELALAMQPKSIPVRKHLAQSFEKNSEYDSAVAQYNIILSIDSTDKEALADVADIYVLAKQWGNASVMYHRLSLLEPNNLEVKMSEGTTAYRAHAFNEAIGPLKAVAAESKNDSVKIVAMKLLAESYFNVKKHSDAVAAYEQLMRKDSTAMTSDDYKQYAGSLLETKDTAKAFSALEAYTVKDTTDCTILKLIGPHKMSTKDYAGAIPFFQMRLKRCDSSVAIYKNIGLCYQVIEKPDSALLWYHIVLEKKPYDSWTISNIAKIYLQHEQQDSVLALYKDYLANINVDSTPAADLIDAYKYVGLIYLIKKDFNNAVDNLKKGLNLAKDDCDITLWLAQSYHNLQQKDEAIRLYKEVIRKHCKNEKKATEGLKILEAK